MGKKTLQEQQKKKPTNQPTKPKDEPEYLLRGGWGGLGQNELVSEDIKTVFKEWKGLQISRNHPRNYTKISRPGWLQKKKKKLKIYKPNPTQPNHFKR